MLAIQMAKRSGLTVIATTRNQEKVLMLLEKGADHVLVVESGVIRLDIGKTFRLDEIADAHRLMDANAAGGKNCYTERTLNLLSHYI